MPLPESRLHSACSLHGPRVHTHAHAHAHFERPDVLSELLAPRVCHPPARSARGVGGRDAIAPIGPVSTTGQPEKKHDSIPIRALGASNPSACAKQAPPIPLVTDATADLPAPIFLIAASPIVIRQGYFKRLRLIYLFLYQLRPCILNHSSNTWPECSRTQLADRQDRRTCILLLYRSIVHARY